jgi:hypothetical protein
MGCCNNEKSDKKEKNLVVQVKRKRCRTAWSAVRI